VDEATESRWREFENLGESEVRKRLAGRLWSEEKNALARQWLDLCESSRSSEDRRQTLIVAKEANDLARSANELALEANSLARSANTTALDSSTAANRSADAARTSNIIATLALAAAVIAIAVSTIGIFVHH